MASNLKNLSDFSGFDIPCGKGMRIAVVAAEWNREITDALLQGAVDTLKEHGVYENDITTVRVPGTFELTFGAKCALESGRFDAVIVIGCVIQGDTRHFDFICDSVTQGITDLNLKYNSPVIFGVLTTDNLQQAQDRAGGKLGNKGSEAAATALQMVAVRDHLLRQQ
ncbi:MAG: 6,7-dimethyl-8-ribityllumazine synthase [Bacteroidales bacterium]|nr:6,7-dimethyl-8-ribityllumazine synthase [Bacteroidales bacterium]